MVRRVMDGNVEAFSVLVDRHAKRIHRLVARQVPASEASEVAHEAFICAFERLETFSGARPFEHWLTRIAVNACADYWRGRKRQRQDAMCELDDECLALAQVLSAEGDSPEFSPENAAMNAQTAKLLDAALKDAAPEDRVALILLHVEEYSVVEVAEMLGWSPSKVKVRAHRARQRLRRSLATYIDALGRNHD